MEHVWNTTPSRALDYYTPFQASKGLPARSALDCIVHDAEYSQPDTISSQGIAALKHTARAFEESLYQFRLQEAQHSADELNKRGTNYQFQLNDKVSFYIPPTQAEAKQMGRKHKHMLQFKGPAKVVKIISNKSFVIEYDGKQYQRTSNNLRPYGTEEFPDLPLLNQEPVTNFQVGHFVALQDTDDPKDKNYNRFHLAKVIQIVDSNAELLNYATFGKNLATAKWYPLYQKDNGVFTTETLQERNKVFDKVLVSDQDYVRVFDVRCKSLDRTSRHKKSKALVITARSRKLLTRLNMKHHVLGISFP